MKRSARSLIHLCTLASGLTAVACTPIPALAQELACSAEFLIDETLANGARWEFCWEHRNREGIVYLDIHYTTPDGSRRKVLGEAAVAQIHVPYDDNGARYHDVSDYGIGDNHMNNLSPTDCPNGTLLQFETKDVLCKSIVSRDPAYAATGTVVAGAALDVFSVSHVGAYNYIPGWRFNDDGSIDVRMGASGRLQRTTSNAAGAEHGWPIGGTTIGISHLHNYYWKLDFDLGASPLDDAVEELDRVPAAANTLRNVNVTRFNTETARSIAEANMRTWRVVDKNETNSEGTAISYEIETVLMGHRDTGPSFEPFTFNDVYFTVHNPCEKFASHNPTTEGCADNLSTFVNGQTLNSADIVVWYGLSFHHIPRDEDAPRMAAHWNSFRLVPRDWTATSVAGTNTAPNLTNPGNQSNPEGSSPNFTVDASDPDGNAITFSASRLPPSLSINPNSGLISGTLAAGSAGSYSVTVSVTDGFATTDASFTWVVQPSSSDEPSIETVLVSDVNHAWKTISLTNTYERMVAVCTPHYHNNSVPLVVRMRNASGNSFEVRLQNPSGSMLNATVVHCLAIEEGAWEFPDGRKIEAYRYASSTTATAGNWWAVDSRAYTHNYVSPVVLGQVMSHNDSDWSVFWNHGPDRTSPPNGAALKLGKHVGEDPDTTRASEDIGYVVIEAGQGSIDSVSYEAKLGADTVKGTANSTFHTYALDGAFNGTPHVVVATMAAMDGANGGWGMLAGNPALLDGQIRLIVDEDQLADEERYHTTEQIGYLALSDTLNHQLGTPVIDPADAKLESLVIPNVGSSTWSMATTANSYDDMVVVCSARRVGNVLPAVVRMRNTTENSFEVRLQNPSGLVTNPATLDCLITDTGTWALPDGRKLEAAKVTSNTTDHKGSFIGQATTTELSFSSPVVFGQVMTFNDPSWSTFWTRGSSVTQPPSSSAIYVGKHVGEDPAQVRLSETIGYIIVESGNGSADGNPYEFALGADIVEGFGNAGPFVYTFASPFASMPAVALVSQAAMDGGQGSWAALRGANPLSSTSLTLAVDEDQVNDSERYHTTEQVGYAVFKDLADISLSELP